MLQNAGDGKAEGCVWPVPIRECRFASGDMQVSQPQCWLCWGGTVERFVFQWEEAVVGVDKYLCHDRSGLSRRKKGAYLALRQHDHLQ